MVHVAGDEHAAAIAVRDYGVGLAPGESAMVFNRFWRADPARARTSGGTGLGLSISLEDTHLHGGWLQAWGRPGAGRPVPAHPAPPRRRRRCARARCRWCPPTPRSRSREPRVATRLARSAVVLGLAAGRAAGCVRMPDDGPVVRDASPAAALDDEPAHLHRPAAAAAGRVRAARSSTGFLDAMTATPIQTNVARSSSPRTRQASWNPERETITYADASPPRPRGGGRRRR